MKLGVIAKKIYSLVIILVVVLVFFWKVILKGAVLVPADLLVGAYYPWRENKFGYEVAVPYKNPLLSDSYSQFFIWKKLIADSLKQYKIPLWNQYSYSGYPLLGNLHSGALYPLNLLMVYLPFNTGWNLFVMTGIIGSTLGMYALLRGLGKEKGASILGGLAYGFCGFSISWMEFATAGQAMIWLPLMLLAIEKKKLFYLPVLIFLLISVGHFQITVYGIATVIAYFWWKQFNREKLKTSLSNFVKLSGWGLWGVLMAAAVLLPATELMSRSIRISEDVIKGINYGLAPLGNIITLAAPDFFGNPATNNYWGFLNYHEVLIYSGILVLLAFIWGVFNYKKLKCEEKFFLGLMILSLFLFFDTPLGRLVYWLGIPGISTSMAGRVAVLFALGGSVLLATMAERLRKESWKEVLKYFLLFGGVLAAVGVSVIGLKKYYIGQNNVFLEKDIVNMAVALRNLAVPLAISAVSFLTIIIFRKFKVFYTVLGLVLVADLFRFGWKYLPQSKAEYVFPETEVTNYLIKDKEIFRVEKEHGPVLSPNTWAMYGLMNPGGYDPMAVAEYTKEYNRDLNSENNKYSRYAEIEKYDAKALGEYNVKYLLALRKDKEDKIPGDKLNYLIEQNDWEKVTESQTVAVLRNKNYLKRAFIEGNNKAEVKIVEYLPEKVVINYKSDTEGELILLDSWYPGWEAKVNGKMVTIDKAREVFRGVKVEKGEGQVEFIYKPMSFLIGSFITLGATAIWCGVGIGKLGKRLADKA